MRVKTTFIIAAFLVSTALVAAKSSVDVPLKNWAIPFDTIVRGTQHSGRLTPETNAIPSGNTTMIAINPCRIVDTRNPTGPFGGPALTAGGTRNFTIPSGPCTGIPVAAAYSLLFTIVNFDAGGGFVTAWPAGTARPNVSIMNFGPNPAYAVANSAVVPADGTGTISVYSSGNTQLIIDINGYFVESASTANTPNTLVLRDGTGSFSAGTITATKVLNAVYQDVAEWVPSGNLEAGTVVVLDPKDGRRVLPSSHAYDTTVAGVVSENPGIVLGQPGADKSQIATTGRVRVLVDADAAPIRVGDLLVTSNESGTAMRSMPATIEGQSFHRPGTIVGKALEPLASGKGRILVLLSLQ